MSGSCVACGAAELLPHLAVAGEIGPRGLIPTTDRFGTALSDIYCCSACGHMPAAAFDLVTMGDVIEHLVAPGVALDRIRELLTPNGIVWLALPDAGSLVARRAP